MRFAALIAAIAIAGCSSDAKQPVSPEVSDRMLGHFFAVSALERAVVRGDRVAIRDNADDLAAERAGDPPGWARRVGELQAAARRAKEASAGETLEPVAKNVVEILAACAGCHADFGIDVEPVSIPKPPAGEGLKAKMRRHQWAMDLLRVGLVFGDERVWKRGIGVMTDAPLDPAELAESGTINPATIGQARTLRRAAGSAVHRGRDQWLATYREVLGTCVGCHAE